jgi:hypothetical protein
MDGKIETKPRRPPHKEDSDKDDHPNPPERRPVLELDDATENNKLLETDTNVRVRSPSIPAVQNARTRDTEKAQRMALDGASQVGAVPVEGPGFDDENRRRSTFENSLEQLFSSRTPPAQGGAVSPSPNIHIEATRVLEDDAMIEAQVQACMDKLIVNITVPVDV